ncbi:conserved hypothetical protein [Ricinus communis]|uniref:Uncharacterized protein n=1 Tax=Ricinus communis TaxID=3988 RepID=B9SYS8_RICCO|nr:conserved hypothetical protein [Ricinus communis]
MNSALGDMYSNPSFFKYPIVSRLKNVAASQVWFSGDGGVLLAAVSRQAFTPCPAPNLIPNASRIEGCITRMSRVEAGDIHLKIEKS